MKLSVILPTYNEKASTGDLIDILLKIIKENTSDFEIIVVDDNSPDKTGYLIKERYGDNPHIHCLIRENERGLATAIKTGILNAKGDIVLVMDTDFNHDPQKIPEMFHLLSRYDVVSGSRYVQGGGILGPQYRYWCSYIFNFFVRITLGLNTRDNLSGFVAFKKEILANFDVDKVFSGYGDYYLRFLYRAQELKLNIIEIPVVYQTRRGGESKTNLIKHLVDYTSTVFKIKFNS